MLGNWFFKPFHQYFIFLLCEIEKMKEAKLLCINTSNCSVNKGCIVSNNEKRIQTKRVIHFSVNIKQLPWLVRSSMLYFYFYFIHRIWVVY